MCLLNENKNMNTSLIIIEWIDGVWKTTLAKWLAHEIKGEYYKTPGTRTAKERAVFDRVWVPVSDRFKFYLEACREDIEKINKMRREWKMVVCDRLIGSTIVHHEAMEWFLNTEEAIQLEQSIREKVEILLIAERNSIISRLSGRPVRTQFETNEDLFTRTQGWFIKRGTDLLIDNTKLEPEETLIRALQFLWK